MPEHSSRVARLESLVLLIPEWGERESVGEGLRQVVHAQETLRHALGEVDAIEGWTEAGGMAMLAAMSALDAALEAELDFYERKQNAPAMRT